MIPALDICLETRLILGMVSEKFVGYEKYVLTVQGDAIGVIQEVVGEEPIQVAQQFVQRLCQPNKLNS